MSKHGQPKSAAKPRQQEATIPPLPKSSSSKASMEATKANKPSPAPTSAVASSSSRDILGTRSFSQPERTETAQYEEDDEEYLDALSNPLPLPLLSAVGRH